MVISVGLHLGIQTIVDSSSKYSLINTFVIASFTVFTQLKIVLKKGLLHISHNMFVILLSYVPFNRSTDHVQGN